MYENGIVAVGDISNSSDSLAVKSKSKIQYHTFIELYDLIPDRAEEAFQKGLQLLNEFQLKIKPVDSVSFAPHAPYTVTKNLFQKINKHTVEHNLFSSIHNQETQSEDDWFANGTGELKETFSGMGINPP